MKRMMYVCDRCGELIGDKIVKIVPYYCAPDTEEYGEPVDKGMVDRHYCDTCTGWLVGELTAGVNTNKKCKKKKKADAAPAKAEEGAYLPRLDSGKMMALHNAGWSDKDIADELNTIAERIHKAVYYQLHKFKKEDEKQ